MIRPSPIPDAEPERLDVHNASIDQPASSAGFCATTDLQTGRICRSPAGHPDGCDFRTT